MGEEDAARTKAGGEVVSNVSQVLRAIVPVLVRRGIAEGVPDEAKRVEFENELMPYVETVLDGLEHDEDQKQRRTRAQIVAHLAVELIDNVVIPEDDEDARASARRAVRMASFVLDEAAALHGVEVEDAP